MACTVALAWRGNAAASQSSLGFRGRSDVQEALRDLRCAQQRRSSRSSNSSSNGFFERRWQRLSHRVARGAFEQILQQCEVDLAFEVYKLASSSSTSLWLKDKAGDVAALLTKARRHEEACAILMERAHNLSCGEMLKLRCSLIKSFASYGLWDDAAAEVSKVQATNPPKSRATQRAYTTLLLSQARKGDPVEAEATLRRMQELCGLKPPASAYRTLLFAYGSSALFEDMQRILVEMEQAGHRVDAVTFTMLLSAYGAHRKLSELLQVLKMMEAAGIAAGVRDWNWAVQACPSLISAASSGCGWIELQAEALKESSSDAREQQLVGMILEQLALPPEACAQAWTKLDLHGASASTAFVMLARWFQELKRMKLLTRHGSEEVEVVTGWGKHSVTEGRSELKDAVASYLREWGSPFRVDRKNRGRFVCRASSLKEWL